MFSSVLFLAVTIIHLKGVSSLWCFHCSEFDIVKLSNNEKTPINCPTICDDIEQWWRNGSGKKHLTFKSTNKTEHCIIGTILKRISVFDQDSPATKDMDPFK